MLTEKEKQGFKELLDRLELEDLVTLTDTVTNRVVSAENRREAVEAILLFSQNASQLLRRKKVKREHLYQYLAEKGYVAPMNADKQFLSRKILDIWGSKQINDVVYDDNEADNPVFPIPNIPIQDPKHAISTSVACNQPVDGQKLAEHFASWFYQILNSRSENRTMATENADNSWGPHHFWTDAKCTVTMLSHQHLHDECDGSDAVSDKLLEVVSNEKLFLNVNTAGVKGMVDAYGLARVTVAGTVHRFQQCLGIFEQSFGLIRDPQMENNWKIKFTDLKLKAQEQVEGGSSAALIGLPAGQLAVRH